MATMDFEYASGNFNYGIFLHYFRNHAISFKRYYEFVWDSGDFDDDVEKMHYIWSSFFTFLGINYEKSRI